MQERGEGDAGEGGGRCEGGRDMGVDGRGAEEAGKGKRGEGGGRDEGWVNTGEDHLEVSYLM